MKKDKDVYDMDLINEENGEELMQGGRGNGRTRLNQPETLNVFDQNDTKPVLNHRINDQEPGKGGEIDSYSDEIQELVIEDISEDDRLDDKSGDNL